MSKAATMSPTVSKQFTTSLTTVSNTVSNIYHTIWKQLQTYFKSVSLRLEQFQTRFKHVSHVSKRVQITIKYKYNRSRNHFKLLHTVSNTFQPRHIQFQKWFQEYLKLCQTRFIIINTVSNIMSHTSQTTSNNVSNKFQTCLKQHQSISNTASNMSQTVSDSFKHVSKTYKHIFRTKLNYVSIVSAKFHKRIRIIENRSNVLQTVWGTNLNSF